MTHVLIVDDERELCDLVAARLRERGHGTHCVSSGEAALKAAAARRPDLVLLDLCLGGMDGIETLRRLRLIDPYVPIVMMTAFGNVQAAVNAMKQGATDFVGKPFDHRALLSGIEVLLDMRERRRGDAPLLVGESPAFRKAMELALKFAVPDISILLLGETGTGKELFARAIHAASKRRRGPFVAVDCSTLPENLIESELFGHERGAFTGATATRVGRFELAQGGTLFLDEIGNPPLPLQAKLLRVLQERRMARVGGADAIALDVRVVSATNTNLKEAIGTGQFRQDLYYRLQEMTICVPPLKERTGDVRRIAEHFLQECAARLGGARRLSEEAIDLLEAYSWPGNVRQLENAVRSAAVLTADVVLAEHLPPEIRNREGGATPAPHVSAAGEAGERLRVEIEFGLSASGFDLKALGAEAAEQTERSLLAALLRRGPMSGARMARMLGVDPKTLRAKLRRYGLESKLGPER